jgi:hypothetical protein
MLGRTAVDVSPRALIVDPAELTPQPAKAWAAKAAADWMKRFDEQTYEARRAQRYEALMIK